MIVMPVTMIVMPVTMRAMAVSTGSLFSHWLDVRTRRVLEVVLVSLEFYWHVLCKNRKSSHSRGVDGVR